MAASPIEAARVSGQEKNLRSYILVADEETFCTSDKHKADYIAAVWIRRGYHNIEARVCAQVDDRIEQVQA